jgi:integral membrane protein
MFTNLSLQTPVGRLRAVAMLEAVSFLVLLFIAMPFKYIAHIHWPVTVAGLAHGLLFLAFCLLLAIAMRAARLEFRLAVKVFIASLIPFGPFVMDRKLRNVNQG